MRLGKTLSRGPGPLLLLLLLLPQSSGAIDLFVRSPRPGQIAIGNVVVETEVLSAAAVAAVEIRVDGETRARLEEPPFRVVLDVGEENRSHTFEITATDVRGESVTRTVVTSAIAVQMELELDLQQLFVTVTREERRVLDLEQDAFEIFDGGERQTPVTFERGDVPLTAVLLIDSSLSMEGAALHAALAGARAFVEGMRELDEAKVIVFSDRLLASTPLTGDPGEVSAVMESVRASGGTAIHDHLYLAFKELERRPGRRVVILLSDGIDVESVLDMSDVEWKAGRMQSLLYWIRPSSALDAHSGFYSVWRDVRTSRQELKTLASLVDSTGGRICRIARTEQAAEAFRDILRELREQYVIGYYPSNDRNDGAWHDVRVLVRAPGVRVRAGAGYFDDQL